MSQRKIIFFGPKTKQTAAILSLFGIYSFDAKAVLPESFFEFKQNFLQEKTQYIFLLKPKKEFLMELEKYFDWNDLALKKSQISVSLMGHCESKDKWYLEAISKPKY